MTHLFDFLFSFFNLFRTRTFYIKFQFKPATFILTPIQINNGNNYVWGV